MSQIMRTAPSQPELKALLSDLVRYGSQLKVANILDVSPGDISRRFNPNDLERKLSLGEGLREVWAICGADPEAGQALRGYIDGLFDSWLRPVKNTGELSLLVCDVEKEAGDLIRAKLQNKPPTVQRKEALEIRAAVDRFIAELDCASQGTNVREMR